MKKLIIICFIFLLSGCSNKINLNFHLDDVTSIEYKNINLTKNDFENILTFNNFSFLPLHETNIESTNLIVKTKDDIYHFSINGNYIIYKFNNKNYYVKNREITNIFNNLYTNYTDNNFYSIELVENIVEDNNLLVKIDKDDFYIKLTTFKDIINFKIHKFDSNSDVDLLYSYDKILAMTNIYIRKKVIDDIRITFDTLYNHNISIVYDDNAFSKTFSKAN